MHHNGFMIIQIKSYFLKTLCCAYLYLLSACAHHHDQKMQALTTNKTILNINQKLEEGTITFDDIFKADYGEYADKDANSREVLDTLVEKTKKYSTKNSNKEVVKIDFDKIINEHMDELAAIILDKDNLKYHLYGADEDRWLKEDPNLHAPLNYYQQQVLLEGKKDTLVKLSNEIVKTIIKTDKDYVINFGILWTAYGNGNQLDECFAITEEHVKELQAIVDKKQPLTENQKSTLRAVMAMEKFEDIITNGFMDIIVKHCVLKKSRVVCSAARKVYEQDMKNQAKK